MRTTLDVASGTALRHGGRIKIMCGRQRLTGDMVSRLWSGRGEGVGRHQRSGAFWAPSAATGGHWRPLAAIGGGFLHKRHTRLGASMTSDFYGHGIFFPLAAIGTVGAWAWAAPERLPVGIGVFFFFFLKKRIREELGSLICGNQAPLFIPHFIFWLAPVGNTLQ